MRKMVRSAVSFFEKKKIKKMRDMCRYVVCASLYTSSVHCSFTLGWAVYDARIQTPSPRYLRPCTFYLENNLIFAPSPTRRQMRWNFSRFVFFLFPYFSLCILPAFLLCIWLSHIANTTLPNTWYLCTHGAVDDFVFEVKLFLLQP